MRLSSKVLKIVSFALFFSFFSSFFLLNTSKADLLSESYIFFDRMQVNVETDITVLLTPSTDFDDIGEDRVLRIVFPGNSGDWCQSNASLTVSGVSTSPVNMGDWTIDTVLPGILSASCNQDAQGDYIEIEGIDVLVAYTNYGVKIDADENVFKTRSTTGQALVIMQLIEDTKMESAAMNMTLLSSDQVLVTAEVSEAETITCNLSTDSVDLGALFKGGAYVTGGMSLTTESSMGFYWTVYGTGDGSNPGLYNSVGEESHLLSAVGVDGRVNLLTGEGFGMVAETNHGEIEDDFKMDVTGIFGGLGAGSDNARVFHSGESTLSMINTNIYYGARAGVGALEGSYTETLTYVCGGYIEVLSP